MNKNINNQIINGMNLINNIENIIKQNPIYFEQWRQVDEYANYYVSNCGRVKNIITERILKAGIDGGGYKHVNLWKNGVVKTRKIHRLVAVAFIDNLHNYKCVDHMNNDKLDNSTSNLRWCTYQQNSMNQTKHKNSTSQYKGVCYHKKAKKWVAQIIHNGKKIHLGCFADEKQAGSAYNTKAKALFGDYAKLNNL